MESRSHRTTFRLDRVRIVAPNPKWPRLFETERQRLAEIAGDAFTNIAHFGSTAVPDLRAKPIIDIMASVPALSMVDAMLPALRGLGYEPAEAGFRKRRFLRRQPAPDGTGYHLHIVTNAAWPDKSELLVRDWLIAHPDAAARYQALKQTLAREHSNDVTAYTAAKSAFLREIINAARQSKNLPPETDWTE